MGQGFILASEGYGHELPAHYYYGMAHGMEVLMSSMAFTTFYLEIWIMVRVENPILAVHLHK